MWYTLCIKKGMKSLFKPPWFIKIYFIALLSLFVLYTPHASEAVQLRKNFFTPNINYFIIMFLPKEVLGIVYEDIR